MYENKNNEQKQKLDVIILKAYLESLNKKANACSGCLGMKNALDLIALELDETHVNQSRLHEIMAELSLYERLLRERMEREAREKDQYDTPFDKIGKAFSGEMQI